MGWKNKNPANRPWRASQDGGGASANAARWHIWPGSWSSPRSQAKAKAGPPARYDQVQVQNNASHVDRRAPGGPPGLAEGRDGLMQGVQKALTASKRCDTKIRRLLETKELRQTQWAQWRQQTVANFMKQKRLYEADLARIDEEVAALQTQGEEAARQMTELVVHGPPAMETAGPTADEEEAWGAALEQANVDPPMMDFMRQAYAAAQAAAQATRQQHTEGQQRLGQHGLGIMPAQMMERLVGCPPPMQYVPPPAPPAPPTSHPPMETTETRRLEPSSLGPPPAMVPTDAAALGTAVPQGYAAISPSQQRIRAEPYPPTSPLPNLPSRPEENRAPTPVPEGPVPPDTGSGGLPQRDGIKDTSKHPPAKVAPTGLSLGQKLEAKREAARGTAMQPFRKNLNAAAEPVVAVDANTGEPPGHALDDIQTVDEELDGASPGFANLE